MVPETRYVRSRDGYLAFQVLGSGPVDLLVVTELLSHCEHRWEEPGLSRALQRLASFTRLILFDRRGTGLSDPVSVDRLPTLEQRAADMQAVLAAVGADRPVIIGFSEGGVDAIYLAATRPAHVSSLILYGAWPCFFASDDYPNGWDREAFDEMSEGVLASWGQGTFLELIAPSVAGDDRLRSWWARYERLAASPGVAAALLRIALDVDVRPVLSSVTVPALVMHRTEDVFSPVGHGHYLAAQLSGARYVELAGRDHPFFVGDADKIIDTVEEFLTGTAPEPHRDRVLVTAMFVDIVDSTDRAARMGNRAWRDLLSAHQTTVRRQLRRFGGSEVDTAGDGFFAAFDGPARAVECATAIRDACRGLGIEVRAGLHTGECEVIDGKIGGLAVHIAARVESLAEPGEVLTSRTIRDLVAGSGIRFTDRGTHRLKGVPDTWQLYRAEVGIGAR
jgi:class 3 adenylate cyclase